MIPTEPMIRNAKASVGIFNVEGTHPQVIHGYQATTLDNYADAWMLRNAFYNGEESALQKSLNVYSYGYTNGQAKNLCESMIAWFLVIGMMTSYCDFLTYPVFTLGIPLLFLLICMREYGDAVSLPATAFKNSVYWAVGYIGMWVQKWILCTVFTGENLVADGIRSIMIRSGRDVMGEQVGYWETLDGNIIVIAKYPYLLAFGAAGLIIFLLCKKYKKEHKVTCSKAAFMTYVYIAVLPFLWYAISINHSYIHSFMTYNL